MPLRGKKSSKWRVKAFFFFAALGYFALFLRLYQANSSIFREEEEEEESSPFAAKNTRNHHQLNAKTAVHENARRVPWLPNMTERRIKVKIVEKELAEKFVVNATFPDHSFYQTPSDGTNLWDANDKLPSWSQRYFNWHKEKMANLTAENWRSERFLIMQCITGIDTRCGGTADRLKTIAWALRLSYNTKRILLIHWTRPKLLTDFLTPPVGGFDWRVPDWLANIMEDRYEGLITKTEDEIRRASVSKVRLLRTRYQSFWGGRFWYDKQLKPGEQEFVKVFHDLWHIFFTPAKPVAALIESEMNRMGLRPQQYVSAHLRVLYGIKDRPEWIQQNWAINAINCASQLLPSAPFFFSSDSTKATLYARNYVHEKGGIIGTRKPSPDPPLHIDKASNQTKRAARDYYDIFVDLYIISMGACITYNKGYFGLLASTISKNSSCSMRQDAIDRPRIHKPCNWTDGQWEASKQVSNLPLFREPMQ